MSRRCRRRCRCKSGGMGPDARGIDPQARGGRVVVIWTQTARQRLQLSRIGESGVRPEPGKERETKSLFNGQTGKTTTRSSPAQPGRSQGPREGSGGYGYGPGRGRVDKEPRCFLSSLLETGDWPCNHLQVRWLLPVGDAVGGVLGAAPLSGMSWNRASERRDGRLAASTALLGGRVVSHKVSTDRGER